MLKDVFILIVPLFVAGVLHMIVVKARWAESFAIPLSQKLFGPNKTLRGLLFMPVGGALGMAFVASQSVFIGQNWLTLGLVLGLAYALAELPNSFFKRRLGIAAGKLPEGGGKIWFALMDQADSALGCGLVYLTFLPLSLVLASIFVGTLVHLLSNLGLYGLGLRKEPI